MEQEPVSLFLFASYHQERPLGPGRQQFLLLVSRDVITARVVMGAVRVGGSNAGVSAIRLRRLVGMG